MILPFFSKEDFLRFQEALQTPEFIPLRSTLQGRITILVGYVDAETFSRRHFLSCELNRTELNGALSKASK